MRLFLTALLLTAAASASAQTPPVTAPPVMTPPAGPAVAQGARLDGIAAVVGDQVVLYSEVDAVVQQTRAAAQGRPVPADVWSRSLDRLVDQKVVIARARQDTTLTVSEEMVTQQVDRQVRGLAAQVGSEQALAAAYGRPIEAIKASFRDDVRDELLLQQFRSRRLYQVSITPGEVRAWFERIPVAERPLIPELVRVAHVVRLPSADDAGKQAVRTFAEALRDSVVNGQATFEAVADRHSTDPGNTNRDGTENGGLYTTLRLSDLESKFRAAAGASQIGAVSPVFETPFGYHFMRVNEREGERISFNHVLLQIDAGDAGMEAARAFLGTLRDSVVTHGVPFEAIARRHSEDPYSASRGGFVSNIQNRQRDLQLDELGPLWKSSIDTLEVGEVSGVSDVKLLDDTPALHFVLLQKRTPAHTLAVADDYSLLSQYALQDKQNVVVAEWVEELRRTVYVDVRADAYRPPTSEPAASR